MFKISVILFSVLSIVIIISMQSQLNDLKKKRTELENLVAEYSEQVGLLEYAASLPEEEYIEKYAREVLGYHKDGEIIFIDETE